ncbi:hypothetical protein K438DRAFT_2023180 [Mycena galopus ATCC 62051]|nr:hypothetical protein K438DRAFT_2023180 [Mycena galopus ATCC 62051]
MATAMLLRRRPASLSHNYDDEPSSPQTSSKNGTTGNAHTAHAGSAFAHGALVASDPRELFLSDSEASQVSGALPKLTLMEEVLLLSIKDKQGYLSFWNEISAVGSGKETLAPPRPPDHGALDAVSGRDAARRDAQDDQADRGRGREDARQHLGRFIEWRNMERPQDRLPHERLVDKAVLRTEKSGISCCLIWRRTRWCVRCFAFLFFCSPSCLPSCTWSSFTRVGGRAFLRPHHSFATGDVATHHGRAACMGLLFTAPRLARRV